MELLPLTQLDLFPARNADLQPFQEVGLELGHASANDGFFIHDCLLLLQEVLELAFSVLYESDEYLNFIAPDKHEVRRRQRAEPLAL